ncbi:MAG: hypothetical protein OXG05_08065 [Gammaproteobacteria bacterium]|nr:hypothetical protein [Gammaproteobacteria bacterium]
MSSKGSHSKMTAWLRVSEESLEGSLSLSEDIPIELSVSAYHVN